MDLLNNILIYSNEAVNDLTEWIYNQVMTITESELNKIIEDFFENEKNEEMYSKIFGTTFSFN